MGQSEHDNDLKKRQRNNRKNKKPKTKDKQENDEKYQSKTCLTMTKRKEENRKTQNTWEIWKVERVKNRKTERKNKGNVRRKHQEKTWKQSENIWKEMKFKWRQNKERKMEIERVSFCGTNELQASKAVCMDVTDINCQSTVAGQNQSWKVYDLSGAQWYSRRLCLGSVVSTPLLHPDLVSRGHFSERFQTDFWHLLHCSGFHFKQCSRDLGRNSSVFAWSAGLSTWVSFVHAQLDWFPRPRPCFRHRSCSPQPDSCLDLQQLSALVGVSSSFLRNSWLLINFTRVSAFISFVLVSTCHFVDVDVSSTHVVLPDVGFCRVPLCSQILYLQ